MSSNLTLSSNTWTIGRAWLNALSWKGSKPENGFVGSNPTLSATITRKIVTMTYVLFLDDVRQPDNVTWAQFPRDEMTFIVRNYKSFVKTVMLNRVPMFVCFDHDLAEEHYAVQAIENDMVKTDQVPDYGSEKTGYDCAKWLVDYCAENKVKFPKYVVHSLNPAGKDRIIGYIENAKKHLGI